MLQADIDQHLNLLAEFSSETLIRVRPDGKLLYLSPTSSRLLGLPPNRLVGMYLGDLVSPRQRARLDQILSGRERTHLLEFEMVREDGQSIWVEGHWVLKTQADTGEPEEWVASLRDITQRHQAYEAVERSEHRFRAIFKALPLAVVYTDAQLRIIECNPSVRSLFGYSPAELADRKIWVLLSSALKDSEVILSNPDEALDRLSVVCLRKDGEPFPAEATRRAVPDTNGGTTGFMWIIADLSDQRRTEAELADTSRRLAESREAERLRLARELHDGAVQDLISISFGMADLQRQLVRRADGHIPGEDEPSDLDALRHHQRELLRVVRQLRALISELRPAGLEDFGLQASLEGFVAKLLRDHPDSSPEIELDLEDIPELTNPLQLCLFRGAQEALHNCLKHAQARVVKVSLRKVRREAILVVEDDGRGFELPSSPKDFVQSDHFGLAGIAERVELVRGLLSIRSRPGLGTEICVTVPLAACEPPKSPLEKEGNRDARSAG